MRHSIRVETAIEVVMRGPEDASKLSLDRYDLIRAQQKDAQPSPSFLTPINHSPVLPPQRPPVSQAPTTTPEPAAPAAAN